MDEFTEVWVGEEYLGRVFIQPQDWAAAPPGYTGNWRHAALHAARRVFGTGPAYHVVAKSYVMGERL